MSVPSAFSVGEVSGAAVEDVLTAETSGCTALSGTPALVVVGEIVVALVGSSVVVDGLISGTGIVVVEAVVLAGWVVGAVNRGELDA